MNSPSPTAAYRWLKIEHKDLDFWGIKGPLPWPAEEKRKIEPKNTFPFARLLEGIERLRAAGREWRAEWGAVETFLNRGDEIGDALERSDFPVVLAALDELETLRPGTAYCAFNRAFILRAQGDYPGAIAAATAATERAPKLEYLWMRRGDLHEHEGDDKSAVFCFRKALSLLPGHAQALEGLARLGAMSKLTLHHPDGTHQVQYLKHEEFARYLAENTARTAPDDPQLRSLLKQFRASQNGANALVVLDRILSGDPADVLLLRVYRADALRMLKRIDEAWALICEVLLEEPTLAEAVYVQGWIEYDRGNNADGYWNMKRVLMLDPNHQMALQVHFRISENSENRELIQTLSDWAKENGSWRAHWLASVQASQLDDQAGALRCAEAAYRLAPAERDAIFLYANSLNNLHEGEHSAALMQPRLPEAKGDYELKYIFAGAMKKLGLRDEAIRVLRESLEEESDMTAEWRRGAQHFLDELTGFLAQAEVDPEFHPGTDTLRRGLWTGDDEGPKAELIPPGVPAPTERPLQMLPAPGYTRSTGSVPIYLHGHNTELDSVSLGWFRAHEIDFAAEKPLMTIALSEHKKLEATARQGSRRLPITWTMYRVPSMETEGLGPL